MIFIGFDYISMLKYDSFRPVLNMRLFRRHVNYCKKKFTFFFILSIRMGKKSIKFDDKKINKSNFYKNKKLLRQMIYMSIKYQSLKKTLWHKKSELNTTLLGMMIMMLLDY